MGGPFPQAAETIRGFVEDGYEIVVHTCRVRNDLAPLGKPGHVEDWLNYFEVPFDEVTAIKPVADLYIDDRALRYTNWIEMREAVARYEREGL